MPTGWVNISDFNYVVQHYAYDAYRPSIFYADAALIL